MASGSGRNRWRSRRFEHLEALVLATVVRWREGEPIRLLRKFLRKRGVHPWSLLLHLEGEEFEAMAHALRVPKWARASSSQTNPYTGDLGFHFDPSLPEAVSAPSGLVASSLRFDGCIRMRKLPWRAWTPWLSLSRMPALRRLPDWVVHVDMLSLEDCPRVTFLPGPMREVSILEIESCHGLQALPRLGDEHRSEPWIRLLDLPCLERIASGSRAKDVQIWKCPALERLDSLRMRGSLSIHGCHALRQLPDTSALDTLDVTDCPRLQPSLPWDQTPDGRYEPWRRPGPEAPGHSPGPGSCPPGPPALFTEEDTPTWPWPPARQALSGAEAAIVRSLEILHLGPAERLRFLARLPLDLPGLLREELAAQPDPPSAVWKALGWLRDMKAPDRPLALAVLAQLEALGLGAFSAMNALTVEQMNRLSLVFCRNWLRGGRLELDTSVVEPCAEATPGPLVLLENEAVWYRSVDLRRVEGPLWAVGSLAIRDCPFLETLPAQLVVEGDLEVADCPSLERLPARLEVWGRLSFRNLPGLDAQTCRAQVGGEVRVEAAPALDLRLEPIPRGRARPKLDGLQAW